MRRRGCCGTDSNPGNRRFIDEHAPVTENVAKFIFAELLLAVEFLQSRKLVHRNLEPNNILLQGSGQYISVRGVSLFAEAVLLGRTRQI